MINDGTHTRYASASISDARMSVVTVAGVWLRSLNTLSINVSSVAVVSNPATHTLCGPLTAESKMGLH